MKVILIAIAMVLQFFLCNAQHTPVRNQAASNLEKPEFPGGNVAMQKYFAERPRCQESACQANGRIVMVNFVITEDGSISNVMIKKAIGCQIDEEAIRVVKSMPKWKPARYKLRPVKYAYVIPVKFVLQ